MRRAPAVFGPERVQHHGEEMPSRIRKRSPANKLQPDIIPPDSPIFKTTQAASMPVPSKRTPSPAIKTQRIAQRKGDFCKGMAKPPSKPKPPANPSKTSCKDRPGKEMALPRPAHDFEVRCEAALAWTNPRVGLEAGGTANSRFLAPPAPESLPPSSSPWFLRPVLLSIAMPWASSRSPSRSLASCFSSLACIRKRGASSVRCWRQR